jgi:hypothetical protein
MMRKKTLLKHCCTATVWSASLLFGSCVGVASAQQNPPPDQTQNPNPDVTQGEVASFDAFLDNHPDLDKELRSNPSLLSDKNWVQNHPDLQAYLNSHPAVRNEIAENPSYFIRRENRYETRERDRRDREQNGNPDVTKGEVVSFDQFLDRHPDLDRQLTANPSLINSPQYLQQHPELQSFLNDHRNVKAEITENPTDFMNRERRYDTREAQRQGPTTQNQAAAGQDRDVDRDRPTNDQDRDRNADRDNRTGGQNPDVTRGEVASFDQFLDQHPEIDRQLSANPSLVNNPQYLQDHPQLQTWLNDHRNVKAEFAENPNDFMSRERRYDTREARRNQQGGVNYDVTRSELASFDQFLDRHPDVDRELSANPSLIDNQQYLQHHPGLQAYLSDHPNVKEEITETPSYFMKREGRYDAMEAQAQRQNQGMQNQNAVGQNMQPEGRNGNPNPDLTRGEIASFDQFLDDHQDINKQLEKNPQLINEAGYVKKHKALATYLNEHPAVREEITENPAYFMKRENRFELSERDRNMDTRDRDNDRSANNQPNNTRTDRDRDIDRDRDMNTKSQKVNEKELKEADKFLSKHKSIDKDLRKNPELAKDPEYLQKHKNFDSFLHKNPEVQEAVRRNPSEFMHERVRVEHMNHKAKEPPAKSKAEKREETRPSALH